MPVDGAKEVAKVVVESSGSITGMVGGLIATASASVIAMWKYLHSKITRIEREAALALVIKEDLDKHITDENGKFEALFTKYDHLNESVTSIRESVARIEGKLDR